MSILSGENRYSPENLKYLELLSEQYPGIRSVYREMINLMAILNLPKGTEHFISDLHGEYDAFCHILNNCSGVIKEKADMVFSERLSADEIRELCTLIYYPEEKLELIRRENINTPEWYRLTLSELIELSKLLSSKYTRSKVRKALPPEFAYVIDELLHAHPEEDGNRHFYHEKIIEAIIGIRSADDFIISLANLIKRLAVDRLHIVGDIFDRGPKADKIIELLMRCHSLDIEWGNHDILWMGAAAGSEACIANVIRNNVKYGNTRILENGYGISLRNLSLFAGKLYGRQDEEREAQAETGGNKAGSFGAKKYVGSAGRNEEDCKNILKAINVILFKLEGKIIKRHPEYEMDDRLLLDKVIKEGGEDVDLTFPTVDPDDPYELSPEEAELVEELKAMFTGSVRLRKHIEFLYSKGSLYCVWNDNLLFHGCMPLTEDGNFAAVSFDGQTYKGRTYFDYAEKRARRAYFGAAGRSDLDFMWYLWGGRKSPLCGRNIKTFERTYNAQDKEACHEESDPYYRYSRSEKTCGMILREFGLYSEGSHIINGHTPVRASEGESPVKAGGRLIVIDGGFCRAYQKTTGIAGYTLIFNSHGLRIKAHRPFEGLEKVLRENADIESVSDSFETGQRRIMVADTDDGKTISEKIKDLQLLLSAYREGVIVVEEGEAGKP